MEKHTTKQVCELLTISDSRLSEYRIGAKKSRKGRVEWTAPPILATTDYEEVTERGRAKIYYFPSAIEKIRAKHKEKKETPNPA